MCVLKLAHKFIVHLYNIITFKTVVDAMVTTCSEELMLKSAVDTEKMNHRYYFENEAQDMELFERMEFQQEEKQDWEDTMKEIKKIFDEWEVEIGLMNTKKFSVVDFHSICSCLSRMNIVVYDCVGRIKRTLFKGGLMSVEPELKEKFICGSIIYHIQISVFKTDQMLEGLPHRSCHLQTELFRNVSLFIPVPQGQNFNTVHPSCSPRTEHSLKASCD